MTAITLFFDATHKRGSDVTLAELAGSLRKKREQPAVLIVFMKAMPKTALFEQAQGQMACVNIK